MANKQTAGLQLIDFKGIDLSNGPVKIKGVYQQVIANKFIKTITNLVYDGYAYDDFPITLTTSDGLTYTGKYIDTVSSEMLQWLSITINNQSEVTVTKELFEGGGGGYEEISLQEFKSNIFQCDLIVLKIPNGLSIRPINNYHYGNKTIKSITSMELNEDGSIRTIGTEDVEVKTKVLESTTLSSNYYPVLRPNVPLLFHIESKGKFQDGITNNKTIVSDPIYSAIQLIGLQLMYYAGSFSLYNCPQANTFGKEISVPSTRFNIKEEWLHFYRDKSISKLLQSI